MLCTAAQYFTTDCSAGIEADVIAANSLMGEAGVAIMAWTKERGNRNIKGKMFLSCMAHMYGFHMTFDLFLWMLFLYFLISCITDKNTTLYTAVWLWKSKKKVHIIKPFLPKHVEKSMGQFILVCVINTFNTYSVSMFFLLTVHMNLHPADLCKHCSTPLR